MYIVFFKHCIYKKGKQMLTLIQINVASSKYADELLICRPCVFFLRLSSVMTRSIEHSIDPCLRLSDVFVVHVK